MAGKPLLRTWLVFFGAPKGQYWWARFLRPGFRHVSAAAWFDLEQRWVYYNPARPGTTILIFTADEWGRVFGPPLEESTACVRIRGAYDRTSTPATWYCVGAMKALLGLRSSALSPHALYLDLLRRGGEAVECGPCVERVAV